MSVMKEKVNVDKENVKKNVIIEERVQHFNKQFEMLFSHYLILCTTSEHETGQECC